MVPVARHTPREWRELTKKLMALRDDPRAERDRRQRAEDILVTIRSNPDARAALNEEPETRQTVLDWDEMI